MALYAQWQDLTYGITTIDTGYLRPGFAASHLIQESGSVAFVDVGTVFSVPRLLDVLEIKGIAREYVTYVMVTHVHLDHAGGAGKLMQLLPNASLVVHPRGARHMIDPVKLQAGAIAVYGAQRFRADYGELVPVPADRVIEAPDGFELDLNGRKFIFFDTPGHARHHYSIYDQKSRGVFSGDTFGLSYREFDTARGAFIFPTTSPVQFEPAAMHDSIERLLSLKPEHIYLTHYGCVGDLERLAAGLHRMIDAFVSLALKVRDTGEQRHRLLVEGLRAMLWNELQQHGCRLHYDEAMRLLECDIELNAQGLGVWLEKR